MRATTSRAIAEFSYAVFSRGLSEAPKPRMSGRMVRAPSATSARTRAWPSFEGRIGKRKRPRKHLPEHLVLLFQ
jgi:hypothetical protein